MGIRAALISVMLIGVAAAAYSAPKADKSDDTFARVDKMQRELNGSCSYPVLLKNQFDPELMCLLEVLRARCNKIDDCYVYCWGNDVGQDIGGGCAHLCNYGLRKAWEWPKGVEKCTRR